MTFVSEYADPVNVLSGVPGPSPWYLRADPPKLDGIGWEDIGRDELTSGKCLLKNSEGRAIALINFYCYLKALDSHRVLIWHRNPRSLNNLGETARTIDFTVVDVNEAQPISDLASAIRVMNEKAAYLYVENHQGPLFELPMQIELGKTSFEYPADLKNVTELLILGDARAEALLNNPKNRAHLSIFLLRPKDSEIEVIPQDWFNQADLDFGYQWVTRVARDPESGRIYGEGIRISTFVLDPSCRKVEKSFHDDPFFEAVDKDE